MPPAKKNNASVDPSRAEIVMNLDYRGEVQKIDTLGYFSPSEAALWLQQTLPGTPESNCGFYLFRVTYRTTKFNNTKIGASRNSKVV